MTFLKAESENLNGIFKLGELKGTKVIWARGQETSVLGGSRLLWSRVQTSQLCFNRSRTFRNPPVMMVLIKPEKKTLN